MALPRRRRSRAIVLAGAVALTASLLAVGALGTDRLSPGAGRVDRIGTGPGAASQITIDERNERPPTVEAFIDAIGVNTHLHYRDTAYGDYERIRDALRVLGLRHVRDSGTDAESIAAINDLHRRGVSFLQGLDSYVGVLLRDRDCRAAVRPAYAPLALGAGSRWPPPPGDGCTGLAARLAAMPGATDAVEAYNEYDANAAHDPDWIETERLYAGELSSVARSGALAPVPKVIGPSFTSSAAARAVGDLSPFVDDTNIHPYDFRGFPGDANLSYNEQIGRAIAPAKPVVATEAGYFTGTAPDSVSETVQAKYQLRTLLEFFKAGIARTYTYELIDLRDRPSDPESNFGILHADGSPKPAFRAEADLIRLLSADADAGPSRRPPRLRCTVDGAGLDVHHLLLERARDGTLFLALWLAVRSDDRLRTHRVLVTFRSRVRSLAVFSPMESSRALRRVVAPRRLSVDVPDSAVVLRIIPDDDAR